MAFTNHAMSNPLHPGAMLLERLEIGWTGPDEELFNRAYSFMAWANRHTWDALRWRQKLRQSKYSPLRGQLYAAIENILEGREEVAVLIQHARPARPPAAHAVTVATPRYIPNQPPAVKQMQDKASGLPREYEEWKTKNITAAALAEVKMLAPVRADEALSLEARAKQATDSGAMHELLKRAASIWAALLNIKEPVLCRSN